MYSCNIFVAIPYYIASMFLTLVFGALRIATFFRCTKSCTSCLFDKMASVQLPEEDYFETAFGWKMLQSVRYSLFMELNRKAQSQFKTPNHVVYGSDGKTQGRLLDFERKDRPLILNFGSLTCPVFRQRLTEYSQLEREFKDVADFVLVYIEEGHPTDGWQLKNNYIIKRHKNLQERCAAAIYFTQTMKFQGQLVVDSMSNECNISFAAFPIRLCIITDGQLQYTGGLGPTFYKPKEVGDWLKRWKATKGSSVTIN